MKTIRIQISIVAFSIISFGLYASPQMPDYIIYRGDTIATYNLILEYYLQKTDTTTTEELFGFSFRGREGVLTSCWRGYQAIYKIENDSIFLLILLIVESLEVGK